MASTVWKGHLTFGLVSMPVRLIRAARAERVKLRQLYRQPPPIAVLEEPRVEAEPQETDLPRPWVRQPEQHAAKSGELRAPEQEAQIAPVRRIYQGSDEGTPVAPSDLVKGYEYEKGRYVVLEEPELRALTPQTSTEIQVVEFVHFQEIDPVYLENSYYVIPDENAEKAYALLLEAMRHTGYAAVGELTMHRRDHVLIVRPGKTGLIAHTMFYPDEVRATEEFRTDTSLVAARELDLAKALIAALAQPFDPGRFKNAFRERLRQLIESKAEGQQTARLEQPRPPAKVVDIMDALKRSLAQAKNLSLAGAEAIERKAATSEQSQQKGRSKKKR